MGEVMIIEKKYDSDTTTLSLFGRLDTSTAAILEDELNKILPNAKKLIFDFLNLEYISSVGLRLLLSAQKKLEAKGKMIIRNANETIMEVFDITGFSNILTVE